jgi:septal ring factor EnvC (AmiA/AmiB activator)
LRRLAQREVALARALAARREQTSEALMALQRLGRRPPAAELVHPDTALDLSRAGAILKAAVEGISRRAEGLEQDLLDLGEARKAIEARRHARVRAVARLGRESGRLDRLIAESMRPDLHRKPERNHNAARSGPSRRAPGDPPAAGPRYPTDGRIVVSFGKSREGRGTSKGITWETASGARVVAPAPGVVAFAGPFRGYGLLLIVEHLDGYHSLLAGLAHIHVGIGQHVRSGDLPGAMGHRGTGNLSLYMELRKNGNPINPLPWLAAGKRKVSG